MSDSKKHGLSGCDGKNGASNAPGVEMRPGLRMLVACGASIAIALAFAAALSLFGGEPAPEQDTVSANPILAQEQQCIAAAPRDDNGAPVIDEMVQWEEELSQYRLDQQEGTVLKDGVESTSMAIEDDPAPSIPGERSTEGKAYGVLVDGTNAFIVFRSNDNYTDGTTGTFTDILGNTYTGTVYDFRESTDDAQWIGRGLPKQLTSFSVADGQKVNIVTWAPAYLFYQLPEMVSCDLHGFDFSHVSDPDLFSNPGRNWTYMFLECPKLEYLDMGDTPSIYAQAFGYLIGNCPELTTFIWEDVQAPYLTDTGMMFMYQAGQNSGGDEYMWGDSKLETIDMSGFDTSHVVDMSRLFSYRRGLKHLDIEGWDTSKVEDFNSMFHYAISLEDASFTRYLDTSSAEDISGMFMCCQSLESLDLSSFDTRNVQNMGSLCSYCSSLRYLDISNFDSSSMDLNGFSQLNMLSDPNVLDTIVLGRNFHFSRHTDLGTYANDVLPNGQPILGDDKEIWFREYEEMDGVEGRFFFEDYDPSTMFGTWVRKGMTADGVHTITYHSNNGNDETRVYHWRPHEDAAPASLEPYEKKTSGTDTYTVPATGSYRLEVWGAQGGNAGTQEGGKGGYSSGTIHLQQGTTLSVRVGGKGGALTGTSTSYYNSCSGGNNGGGGSYFKQYDSIFYGAGGGGTDIRLSTGSTADRIIVAGGGGGAAYNRNDVTYSLDGGAAGGYSGSPGGILEQAGAGGTQTSGGTSTNQYYSNAAFYQGGSAQSATNYLGNGAGGGGGWYGGAAGISGGGGSGYVYTSATVGDSPSASQLNRTYLLEDTQLLAGNEYIPAFDGGTELGHSGVGCVRITPLDVYAQTSVENFTPTNNVERPRIHTSGYEMFQNPNYSFRTWNTEADGSGTEYSPSAATPLSGDIDLYAQWDPNVYTIRLDQDGGSGGEPDVLYAKYGYGLFRDPAATRQLTWMVNENSLTPPTKSYNVIYDPNGGTLDSDDVVFAKTYDYNFNGYGGGIITSWGTLSTSFEERAKTIFTIDTTLYADWTRSNIRELPQRDGYSFKGWSTTTDSSGIVANSTGYFSAAPGATYHAIWDNSYTVSFNANGGTGASMPSATVASGTSTVLPSCAYSKDGKEFKGWAEGSASGVVYQPGDNYAPPSDIALYAVWGTPSLTHTISFNANGGSGNMSDILVPDGCSVRLPECSYTKTGAICTSWARGSASGTACDVGQALVPSGNMTFYAIWEEGYDVVYHKNGGDDAEYVEHYKLTMEETPAPGNPVSFTYTQTVQTYTAPASGNYKLEVWGAQGGQGGTTNLGGKGGYSVGTVSLEAGDILYIYVGGKGTGSTTNGSSVTAGNPAGGWNGGGQSYQAGSNGARGAGGGATDIALVGSAGSATWATTNHFNSRIIVAGGGGGNLYFNGQSYTAGTGGGLTGGNGGGDATGGGQNYAGTNLSGGSYTAPVFGRGGYPTSSGTLCGGGGGWYGGGAGNAGAGGSGFVYTASTASYYPSTRPDTKYYLSEAETIAGNQSFPAPDGGSETGHAGNGYARITPLTSMQYASYKIKDNVFQDMGALRTWYTAADGTGTEYPPGTEHLLNAGLQLYAQWITGTNAVVLDDNKGTGGSGTIYEVYGTGIYKDLAATEEMTASSNAASIPHRGYDVTLDPNGGKYNGVETPTTVPLEYVFCGYYDGDVQLISPSGFITSNFSNDYFSSNGNAKARWTQGEFSTLPTRDGYSFLGWATTPSGSPVAGSTGTWNPVAGQVYYAQWSHDSYTVSFDANGGTGTVPDSIVVLGGGSTTLPSEPALEKEGFVFGGWTAGSPTGDAYPAGASFSPAGDTAMYAIWSEQHTVTYHKNTNPDETYEDVFTPGYITKPPLQVEETFEYTGRVQTFTAPADGTYVLEVWGAQGGNAYASTSYPGGKGGYSKGSIRLLEGETIYIYVGGAGEAPSYYGIYSGGWNGGGNGSYGRGAPGGGGTDIRVGGTSLESRVIVAGGGGGGGAYSGCSGGAGGGVSGSAGVHSRSSSYAAKGGTATAGGAGGTAQSSYLTAAGSAGVFGQGGNASATTGSSSSASGGGGGGWYGGGGGGYYSSSSSYAVSGGGGGSGFVYTSGVTVPSNYEVAKRFQLSDASTKSGNESFVAPTGESETGHAGNGFARISCDYSGGNAQAQYRIRNDVIDYPGHTLRSWNDQANLSGTEYEPLTDIDLNGDLELFAQWSLDTYTLGLYDRGSGGSGSIYEIYGQGFYKTSTGSLQMTSSANPVAIPIRGYSVTLDPNGGTYNNRAQATTKSFPYTFGGYYDGETQIIGANGYLVSGVSNIHFEEDTVLQGRWFASPLTAVPTRFGYTFLGWSDNPGGSLVSDETGVISEPLEGKTYYAQWSRDTYVLSFNANGGSGTAMTDIPVDGGDSTTLPGCSYENADLHFVGWAEGSPSGEIMPAGAEYTPSASTTFYAIWASSFTITYYKNDGSEEQSSYTFIPGEENGTSKKYSVLDVMFSRDHMHLRTWATESDGTGAQYAPDTQLYITSDLDLYAQWDYDVYEVTLNDNGGSGGSGTIYERYSVNVYKDASLTQAMTISSYPVSVPTRSYAVTWDPHGGLLDGSGDPQEKNHPYAFDGYYKQDAQIINSSGYRTGDFFASTFDSDGIAVARWHQSPVVVEPTRQGYTFIGWSMTPDGQAIQDSASGFIPTVGQTYYAQWERTRFTMSFESNGGSGTMSSVSVWDGDSFTLPACEFDKDNVVFSNWAVGSPSGQSVNEGDSFTPTQDTVFYAVWAAGYKIRYHSNDARNAVYRQNAAFPYKLVNADEVIDNYDGTVSRDFSYTGTVQAFTAPATGDYTLQVWGAEGGAGYYPDNARYAGGKGGYSEGTVHLEKDTVLYIYVGEKGRSSTSYNIMGGGWNGGGSGGYGMGGSGGGSTDIALSNTSSPTTWNVSGHFNSRIIVAGGGGGGAYSSDRTGGAGGGISGEAGHNPTYASSTITVCGGGTQSSGGTRNGGAYAGNNGVFGYGGSANTTSNNASQGGGGGGGWYGGAGSGFSAYSSSDSNYYKYACGGGGGSGYVLTGSSYKPSGYTPSSQYWLSNASTIAGTESFASPSGTSERGHTGNGHARITYNRDYEPVSNERMSAQTERKFGYTGEAQTFVAPFTGTYTLRVWGAQGGDGQYNGTTVAGGKGGYSIGTVYLNAGDVVEVNVGGQGNSGYNGVQQGGFNGGGRSGYGYGSTNVVGGGGGATDIRIDANSDGSRTLYERVIVAGGGGGGIPVTGKNGGYGGGATAGDGSTGSTTRAYQGSGATQVAGGEHGTNGYDSDSREATSGTFGVGGNASFYDNQNYFYTYNGSGGGGGWYGGGGGSSSDYNRGTTASANCIGSGGGGSGWVFTESTYADWNSGNPEDAGQYLLSSQYWLLSAQTMGGNQSFTSPAGNTETGHTGNGYAVISFKTPASLTVLDNMFDTEIAEFLSWNTQADNQGTMKRVGDSMMLLGDADLYAQWVTTGQTVSYHKNDGSGETHVEEVPYPSYGDAESGWEPGRTETFNFTGSVQPWTVPATGLYKLQTWGAGTDVSSGGYSEGLVSLTKGTQLYVYVGGQGSTEYHTMSGVTGYVYDGGFNGGGMGRISTTPTDTNRVSGGSGATDIRINADSLYNRVIVAGGAGGSSRTVYSREDVIGTGGDGGGYRGSDGTNSLNGAIGTAGGYYSQAGYACNESGTQDYQRNTAYPAGFGFGGGYDSAYSGSSSYNFSLAGGGGGWYGGGAGLGAGGGGGWVYNSSAWANWRYTPAASNWGLDSTYYLSQAFTTQVSEGVPSPENGQTVYRHKLPGVAKITLVSDANAQPISYTVEDNMFSWAYHDFQKWNTEADGLGTDKEPGDTLSLSSAVHLYAQWKEYRFVTYHKNDEGDTETLVDKAYVIPEPMPSVDVQELGGTIWRVDGSEADKHLLASQNGVTSSSGNLAAGTVHQVDRLNRDATLVASGYQPKIDEYTEYMENGDIFIFPLNGNAQELTGVSAADKYIQMRIVGVNHDTLGSDSSATAGLTFQAVRALPRQYAFNNYSSDRNDVLSGGWKESQLRNIMNPDSITAGESSSHYGNLTSSSKNAIWDMLPTDLQNAIVPVKKSTASSTDYGNVSAADVVETTDALWLTSSREITSDNISYGEFSGVARSWVDLEGEPYAYWNDHRTAVITDSSTEYLYNPLLGGSAMQADVQYADTNDGSQRQRSTFSELNNTYPSSDEYYYIGISSYHAMSRSIVPVTVDHGMGAETYVVLAHSGHGSPVYDTPYYEAAIMPCFCLGSPQDISVSDTGEDERYQIRDCMFTWAEHGFRIWGTDAAGEGEEYAPGTRFDASHDLDLYAQWLSALTVTYHKNDGSGNDEIYQDAFIPWVTSDEEPYYSVSGESVDFSYTGASQSWTAPATGDYRLQVWGAQGGTSSGMTLGGKGGYSEGVVHLEEGETLNVYVGGAGGGNPQDQWSNAPSQSYFTAGGFNGGGRGYSRMEYYTGAGGGATDIRIGSQSLYSRVIVAGGGGGGTDVYSVNPDYSGAGLAGVGGGSVGGTGYDPTYYTSATGGTQVSGGRTSASDPIGYMTDAGFGIGGSINSGFPSNSYEYERVSGGGGGWYGGASNRVGSSGGGSGWVYTEDAFGTWDEANHDASLNWLLSEDKYLKEASTVSGNQVFASPSGADETGHAGNGHARITPLVLVEPEEQEPYIGTSGIYTVRDDLFSRTKYCLVSWNESPDGTGAGHVPGSQIEVSQNIDLYASWLEGYAVTYHKNEEGASEDETYVDYAYPFGSLSSGSSSEPVVYEPAGQPVTFDYSLQYEQPGTPTYTVPQSGLYKLQVWGSQGASGNYNGIGGYGGKGGYSEGIVYLNANEVLYVHVGTGATNGGGGQAGTNGAGNGGNTYYYYDSNNVWTYDDYAPGGGGTDIRIGQDSLYSRVIVAGGGGGGTSISNDNLGTISASTAGVGGGAAGGTGTFPDPALSSGGGTQVSAGQPEPSIASSGYYAPAGFGVGGGASNMSVSARTCSGGGSGWYGGAGGYGGGGGSGWVYTEAAYEAWDAGNHADAVRYNLDESKYLLEAQTFSGTQEFASPIAGLVETGHTGEGYAVITPMAIAGSDGTSPSEFYGEKDSDTYTVLDSMFEIEGLVFRNWDTAADDSGVERNAGDVIALEQDTDFYAQWSSSSIITYYKNDGSNETYADVYYPGVGTEDGEVPPQEGTLDSVLYSYTGEVQTFTAPKAGVYQLEAWGAQGGNAYSNDSYPGGKGGYAKGLISLAQNETVYIRVGGQGNSYAYSGTRPSGGFNGGGDGSYNCGGSGGGASDIRVGSDSLNARVLVAGGGGGAANYNSNYRGGIGGGESGGNGYGYSAVYNAKGGTQSSGGAAGTYNGGNYTGVIGTFGQGGNANANNSTYSRSGGGGGGWYGGGGGGYNSSSSYYYYGVSGGGGGSGYVYTSATAANYPSGCLLDASDYLTGTQLLAGDQSFPVASGSGSETGHSGNGYVRISEINAIVASQDNVISQQHSEDFNYTGSVQTFVAPMTGDYVLETWGAQGANVLNPTNDLAGKGGYSKGTVHLEKDTVLYVQVGQQGGNNGVASYNGGGRSYDSYYGSGGGGATDIRIGQDNLYARVIVAGGGGGSGGYNGYSAGQGGYGGGAYSGNGLGNSTITNASPYSGSSFGYGRGNTSSYYSGGGGGGWYGGYNGTTSYVGGSGGSGWVYTAEAYSTWQANNSSDPYQYLLDSQYYLSDASTNGGNTSFASPSGNNETGHSGNGYARITYSLLTSGEGVVPEGGDIYTVKANMFTYSESLPAISAFRTWNTSSNGTGTDYPPGSQFVPQNNMDLYAQWQSAFTIRFHANGGTGTTADMSVPIGDSCVLNGGTFEKSLHKVKAWALGSPDGYQISVGDTVVPQGNLDLYAIWEPKIIVTYHQNGDSNETYEQSAAPIDVSYDIDNGNGTVARNFEYTGEVQEFTAPVSGDYTFQVWGAQGGYRSTSANGGKGGYSVGTVRLSMGETLYIYVGGSGNTGGNNGGFNGGGGRPDSSYPGGGGASDVRIGSDSLYARLIVAGGGGSDGAAGSAGGSGGGTNGAAHAGSGYGSGGGGGSQTGGGTGGSNNSGSFGLGGNGLYRSNGYGGAGGGGWYGGGGTYPDGSGDDDYGGGGGSGYIYTSSTASNYPSSCLLNSSYYLSNASTYAGTSSFISVSGSTETGHSGDGYVRVTFPKPPSQEGEISSINFTVLPNMFAYAGHYFKSWNSEANNTGDEFVVGETIAATGDQDIYAQWGLLYTITLDDNGGSGGSGAVYDAPDEGVFKDSLAQTHMTVLTNPVSIPTKSYYVYWNPNGGSTSGYTSTYTATYYYNFGGYLDGTTKLIESNGYITGSFLPSYFNQNATISASWTKRSNIIQTASREGYYFRGWSSTQNGEVIPGSGSNATWAPEPGHTYYAVWETAPKIVYHSNNGSDTTNQTLSPASTSSTATSVTITIPSTSHTYFTYAGKYFKGWATTSDATVPEYYPASTSPYQITRTTEQGDIHLYAVWGDLYEISLNRNGGTGGTELVYEKYGSSINLSSTYGVANMTSSSAPITAPTKTYRVTWDPNGGKFNNTSSATTKTYNYNFDGYFDGTTKLINGNTAMGGVSACCITGDFLATRFTENTELLAWWSNRTDINEQPSQFGYVFMGWSETRDGEPLAGSSGNWEPQPGHTYYAIWSGLPKMVYHANDGTENQRHQLANPSYATVDNGDGSLSVLFPYTGNYATFAAPVTGDYTLQTWGAQGGNAASNASYVGGKGGYSIGQVHLNQGDTLYIYVGGEGSSKTTIGTSTGGWNGGGSGGYNYGGSGGGATDIRLVSGNWNNTASLNSRIIVAGGGGGATSYSTSLTGGAGGGEQGSSGGSHTSYTGVRGGGGAQSSGGSAGVYNYYATGGSFGTGGAAYSSTYCYGGGGGGGWYGGGGAGGASSSSTLYSGGGGGGGSGYVLTTSSAKPSDYSVTSEYYLSDSEVLGATVGTHSGTTSFVSPDGGLETGHTGNGYAKITYAKPEGAEDPSYDFTVLSNMFSYSQHYFVSWNDAASGEGETRNPGDTISISSDKHVYAQWKPMHTLTFDKAGGTGGTNAIFEKYESGFYVRSTDSAKMTPSTQPISLPRKDYEVSWNPNGGTMLGSTETQVMAYAYAFGGYYDDGTLIITSEGYLADNFSPTRYEAPTTLTASWKPRDDIRGIATRDGYVLMGWSETADGEVIDGSWGQWQPQPGHTYYAVWEAPHVITYHSNNGEDTTTTSTVAPTTFPDTNSATLNAGKKTATYAYTGRVQTFTAPVDGDYKLEVWGAQGGYGQTNASNSTYAGGKGGYSVGTVRLSAGETLYIRVGGQGTTGSTSYVTHNGGYNGGGSGYYVGAGGGGATDIRIGLDDSYARVIVAGGGGGGSGCYYSYIPTGGAGGGTAGLSGNSTYSSSSYGGKGGSQTAGGTYGTVASSNIVMTYGTAGKFALGGSAPTPASSNSYFQAGGGGGGWYGGGAGSSSTSAGYYSSAGGGGSGYVYKADTAANYPSGCLLTDRYYLKNANTIAGNAAVPNTAGTANETGHAGNGYAKITYDNPVALVAENGVQTAVVASNTFSYADHSFFYWNTETTNAGDSYVPGDKIELPTDRDLYAIWKDPTKAYAVYHANNGTGAIKAYEAVDEGAGLTHTVVGNDVVGFSNGRQMFTNWADAAEDGTEVSIGTKIEEMTAGSDYDLHAQWIDAIPTQIQAKVNLANAELEGDDFEFAIYGADRTQIGTVHNDENGDVVFDVRVYPLEEGQYEYYAIEQVSDSNIFRKCDDGVIYARVSNGETFGELNVEYAKRSAPANQAGSLVEQAYADDGQELLEEIALIAEEEWNPAIRSFENETYITPIPTGFLDAKAIIPTIIVLSALVGLGVFWKRRRDMIRKCGKEVKQFDQTRGYRRK